MNKFSFTALFILGTVIFGHAQMFPFDSVGYKYISIGKVIMKGDVWIIREGEGNKVHDYYPVNIEERFMIEGQDVVFAGTLGRIPENVRMNGTPLKLDDCRKLYRTNPKEDGSAMEVDRESQQEAPIFLENRKGKILYVGGTWIIEMEGGARYVPDYLPDDFKSDNLQIEFSGNAGKNPPNVKALGDPLTITSMVAIEEQTINPDDIQEPMRDFYPFEITEKLSRQEGVVKKYSDDPEVYFIETENGTRRFLPAIIPADFKKHNLKIFFSGNVGAIPPNVRMIGTPFELETIEMAQ